MKNAGTWSTIKAKAHRLRHEISRLVDDVDGLTGNNVDAIVGSAFLQTELEAWRKLTQDAGEKIRTIAERTRQAALINAEMFTDQLKSSLTHAGLTVYGDGGLLIADGIVHIQASTQGPSIQINGQEQGTFYIPDLVARIEQRTSQLKADLTPPPQLIPQLCEAYKLTCYAEAKEVGTRVQTLAILPYLALVRQRGAFRVNPTKEVYRPYPVEQFRADLHYLLQNDAQYTTTHGFRYASGSDTKGAVFMFVPALGRTAHIGRIWFEKIT